MKFKRFILVAAAAVFLFPASIGKTQSQSELVPPEVMALFEDIFDIDKLRVINALKLSNDQLEQIIAAIKVFQLAYNKTLVDTVMPPLKEITKDIKETRSKMLKGAPIPSDLDEKVKKLQEAFVKKRDTVEYNTLKGMADTFKKILSASQVATAVALAKKATEVDGKPSAKGEDDKFFNLYVLNVFLRYPRIMILLEDIRKAKTAVVRVGTYREARK